MLEYDHRKRGRLVSDARKGPGMCDCSFQVLHRVYKARGNNKASEIAQKLSRIVVTKETAIFVWVMLTDRVVYDML